MKKTRSLRPWTSLRRFRRPFCRRCLDLVPACDREWVRAAVKGGQRPAQRTLDGCVEDEQETHNGVGRAPQARPVCAVGFAR